MTQHLGTYFYAYFYYFYFGNGVKRAIVCANQAM